MPITGTTFTSGLTSRGRRYRMRREAHPREVEAKIIFTIDGPANAIYASLMKRARFTELERNRALHLVDIENLLGGADFSECAVQDLASAYAAAAGLSQGDHVVVASSHHAAAATWFGWPGGRLLVRSGPNGADIALLEVIAGEGVSERYERVVIASGDGAFADAAGALQADGTQVIVVSKKESLARRLKFAVREVRYLEDAPQPTPALALKAA